MKWADDRDGTEVEHKELDAARAWFELHFFIIPLLILGVALVVLLLGQNIDKVAMMV